MRDRRVITTREVTNEDGEKEIRPVLAVRDTNKYRPNDKGTARVGPPKPHRNHGQAS